MRAAPALLVRFVFLGTAATQVAAQTVPEWRFVQELRIGSLEDVPAGFSDVRGLVVDGRGNIWVLEASTQDIRVFDPTGKHLRTVGRKGSGPGEFVYADGMALSPDGLIWVHDPQNGRFSIFKQDGAFARQQLAPSPGYGFVWNGGIDRSGRIWDQLFIQDPNDPFLTKFRRAAPDWSRVDTLTIPRCGSSQNVEDGVFRFPRGGTSVPFYPGPVLAHDYSAAAIWCAPSSVEYRLVKVGLERHDTIARIAGKAAPIRVTAAERDSAIAAIRKRMERAGPASLDWSRIPAYKPLIKRSFVDETGRLWLSRTTSDGSSLFDIYSPQGAPVAVLRVDHQITTWTHPVIRGQTAWFIARDDDDVPYVIRGRIGPR